MIAIRARNALGARRSMIADMCTTFTSRTTGTMMVIKQATPLAAIPGLVKDIGYTVRKRAAMFCG